MSAYRNAGASLTPSPVIDTTLRAVPDAHWAIEVDLHRSHFELDRAAADARRDRATLSAGWIVRRAVAADMTSLPLPAARLRGELDARRRHTDEVRSP